MVKTYRLALAVVVTLTALLQPSVASAKSPLRVFIRASDKTHGPGAHDYPRFLADWTTLLNDRGVETIGAMRFPTRAELKKTDVLVIYASDGANVAGNDRQALEDYLRSGGGMVVLHDGICGNDPEWFKGIAGGAKQHGRTNWHTGKIGLYFDGERHPITKGLSNFDLDDELFFQVQLAPETRVLATSFHTAKEIVPQMWVYEKRRSRVFVSLQGHNYSTFNLPHYRGLLLRAIAWCGRRDVDEFTRESELVHFRYPPGGPTSPSEARAKIEINPEFDLSLVAAEPLVVKPISIDWDPRGRMWVANTPEYPFKEGKGRGRDSIVILEDVDSDGQMDRRTVFAEGLVLPTSFVFWRDGVIVAQAPQILFLRDRNGDGKADRREVLFSGFGTFDTHAVINNLRWGLDGWVYGCQGYSGNDSTNVINSRGQRFGKIGNGIFRFRPDGSAMEQVSSYGGNSWGIDFSDDGELFFSKANGPHINHVVMPERYLSRGKFGTTASEKSIEDHQKVNPVFTDPRHEYVQVAPVGVFTAASGCTLYTGGAWPERYHNSHFVCEPTVHIVHEDLITRMEGPSFEATRRDDVEFLAARDLWFRPVHTRIGPDGQMYLLDFYNQAVSHNDIRGVAHGKGNAAVRPDRDHDHGRIYRIAHKQQRRLEPYKLHGATGAELVRALQHPNMWVRMTAQRLLSERQDQSAVPALVDMFHTNRFINVRLHALWTMHHLGALAPTNLIAGITNDHPSLKNNALRIAAELPVAPPTNVIAAVLKQLRGNTERTRLEALFALTRWQPRPETIAAVHKLFPDLKDGWSKSAVLGIARLAPTNFIRASFASDKSDSYPELVEALTGDFIDQRNDGSATWVLRHVGRQSKAPSKLKAAVLDTFNKSLPDYAPPFSPAIDEAIKELLETDSRTTRIAVFPLAMHYRERGSYGEELTKVRKALVAELQNEKAKEEDRNTLLSSLVKVSTLRPEIIAKMDDILAKKPSGGVQKHVVTELGTLTDKAAAAVLIRHFEELNSEARMLAFGALAKRPDWSQALLDALKAGDLKSSDLGVLGRSRLRSHPDAAIARKAATLFDSLDGPTNREKEALIARFLPALQGSPNIDNGRDMFTKNCTICHKFNDKGKEFGPDLTGVGLHGPEVLLTHILDPNRVVEANFYAYNVTTKKGEEFTGLIKTENRESVTLKNLEGEVTVKRSDIESMRSSGLSLMPEGLEALGEKNIRDIIGYITARTPKGFRALDLASAFTADSRRGLFASQSDPPSLAFKQFGVVMVDKIPFHIVNPSVTSNGNNVVVLRGGEGFAKTRPQRVEFNVNIEAKKIYILGGVAGWGFPWGQPEGYDVPVAKAVITFKDGKTEEFVWKNGEEFADYVRPYEVPGSKAVAHLTTTGQLRWFSVVPQHQGEIKKIALESFDNHVAPTFVALTAQVD